MDLIQWREEFCTGISGVDYEHEKLISEINSVYRLIDDQAEFMAHPKVDKSTMSTMLKKARKNFLNLTNKGS